MNDEVAAADAKSVGLRYVGDDVPGIRRKPRGKSFAYVAADGRAVRDRATLDRIEALAVPPAYTDVWISPLANGHMQATGRDARGRKQYRYHAKWREVRDGTKYARTVAFAKTLPKIRQSLDRDLRRSGLPREKVLAAVVRLLETTTIRVGNEEYARENGSYGLTTMHNAHVKVSGGSMRFSFRGKSKIRHAISLEDRRLAKIVRTCQELPGQRLFQYVDDDGEAHAIESNDVNEYIRSISGDDFTAKDFRTWEGTVACAMLLADRSPIDAETERKRQVADAMKLVAARLGNTPTVCRTCYVHPAILATYLENGTLGKFRAGAIRNRMSGEERSVFRLLERLQS
ncbi:MAG: DNA topoisomerase IB [Candidatus Eremiobacteraeota bacterium]|nr:DNA topoisomerase IB [Candidatus Eremiobacteraeota bacterium]